MDRHTLAELLSRDGLFVDGDWVESKDQDPAGDVRLIQLADVGDGIYMNKSARFLTSEKARQLKCTFLQPGDILVARMPDPLGRACIFPGDVRRSVTVVDVCIVRTGPSTDSRWLLYAINSPEFRRQIERHIKGTTRQRISRTNLGTIELDVPSPLEQRRVVEILDKANAVRRKWKEAIGLTEELVRSTFLEMFGDPVTNPKGWRQSTFGQEVELLEYGPRFYNEKYSNDGVRIVRITDLDSTGRLDFSAMPRLDVNAGDKSKYTLRPGDVIFARSGATVGKTAFSMPGDPEAIPGAYFIRLRFKSRVIPLFAREVLASDRVQQIIVSRSRQSAQQNFSGPGIRELPLPLPPIEMQHRFDMVANGQRSLLRDCRLAEAESERMFASLLHRMFGEKLEDVGELC